MRKIPEFTKHKSIEGLAKTQNMKRDKDYNDMRLEQHVKGIPHTGGKPCPFCTGKKNLDKALSSREKTLRAKAANTITMRQQQIEERDSQIVREKEEFERCGYLVKEIRFVPCRNYPEGHRVFKRRHFRQANVLDEKNGQCACSFEKNPNGCGFFNASPCYLLQMDIAGFELDGTFQTDVPSDTYLNGDTCYKLNTNDKGWRFRSMMSYIVSTKNSNKQTCDEDVNFINNSDFHIYISNGVVRRRLIAHATAYNNGDMSFTLLVSVEYDGYEMLE